MTSKKNVIKERKFFLNNMNTWFSNFIIEEFRTDYIADTKKRNEFMGTMNTSGHGLPRLFEPKETKIEIGYNYNQEVFNNDIFIYNMDDSNLEEIEFIIRGLKTLKYDTEKTLILVSNIMTWGKTPQKIIPQEEIEKEGFDEEEYISPSEEEERKRKEEEEKKKAEEEEERKKKEEEENQNNETSNNPLSPTQQPIQPPPIESESKPENAETSLINPTSEQAAENKSTNKSKPASSLNVSKLSKQAEPKQDKIFYYKDSDYQKRVPNKKYFQYKLIETLALTHNNPNLKTYIICPGFVYGCGENFFFDYFRMCWLGKPNPIPIIGEGKNCIPTIHILDLVQIIKRVIDKKPQTHYIFACDKTKNSEMKNILQSIANAMGGTKVEELKEFNIDKVNIPNFIELSIDVKIKPSKFYLDERKPDEDIEDFEKRKFNWHCEFGIPENLETIRNEFNLYRNLKSVKIFVGGPPSSGKTYIAEKLAAKLKLSHLKVGDLIEWAKELNDELGEEIRNKFAEIEETVKQAIEDYEKRKGKRKTDPPLDTTNLRKLPPELLIKIIRTKLKSSECISKGYILDGFPRKYADAVELFRKPVEKPKVEESKEGAEQPPVQNQLQIPKMVRKLSSNKTISQKSQASQPVHDPIPEVIEVEKDLLPDSVILITNCTEESLKEKIKTIPGYEEDQVNIEARFARRYADYKATNEVEGEKKLADYFKDNKVEVFSLDDEACKEKFEDEYKKLEEFLERDGPIDNYDRLCEEDYEDPIEEGEDEEEKPEENEEKEEVKEVHEEEEESEPNLDTSRLNSVSEHEPSKTNKSKPEQGSKTDKKEDPNKLLDSRIDSRLLDSHADISQLEEKSKSHHEIGQKPTVNLQVQAKLEELKEREQKLLEKKSEVLRRYLSENVIPLLAKGVLNVCQNMPDDPVDALANFLLDNSFNKSVKNEGEESNNNFPSGLIDKSNAGASEINQNKQNVSANSGKNSSNNVSLQSLNKKIK